MLTDTQISRLVDIGMACCHMGLVPQARDIFSGVLAVKPQFIPSRIGLGLSHIVVDEHEQAVDILEAVLQEAPADGDALVMLGLSYFLRGQHHEAAPWLERAATTTGPAAHLAKDLLQQSP